MPPRGCRGRRPSPLSCRVRGRVKVRCVTNSTVGGRWIASGCNLRTRVRNSARTLGSRCEGRIRVSRSSRCTTRRRAADAQIGGARASSRTPAASIPRCTPTRPWTMRQYAGFGTAAESNARYHELLAHGHDGPVRRVRPADPDGLRLRRRRSRTARSARSAWRSTRSRTCGTLFDGIPLDQVSTSMTINAPALGAAAALPAGRRGAGRAGAGAAPARSRTTSSRSTSPAARTSSRRSRRCGWSPTRSPTAAPRFPKWNTISISGYHMAEAGATPAQEIAFTLANGIDVRARRDRSRAGRRRLRAAAVVLLRRADDAAGGGGEVPRGPADLGPGHARRVRRAGPEVADAALPHPDRRRAADRAAARGQPGPGGGAGARPRSLGGTQSLHTNSYDEAIALPTEKAARLALRTQQVLAYETDLTATVDPFAGSYVVEAMTDEVEAAARELMARVADVGWRGRRRSSRASRSGDRDVGVPDRPGDRRRLARRRRRQPVRARRGGAVRAAARRPGDRGRAGGAAGARCAPSRDGAAVDAALADLRQGRRTGDRQRAAIRCARRCALRATVGEVCDALRGVWGVYHPVELSDRVFLNRASGVYYAGGERCDR